MAIVEKQTIRFTPDRKLQGRSVNLGNEGDNMVRRIMFALPDVDEHQAATLMYGGRYADMIRLTAMDGKWAADLTSKMVGAAGEVEGYIRIDGPDGEVWRSDPFRIETGDVPEIEVQIEKLYPTAIGQMLNAMEEHSGKMRESEELLDRLNEEAQAAADTARTAAAAADGASLVAEQHRNAAETAAEGAGASEVDAEAAAESARRMAAAAQAQAQEAALSAEGAASEAVQAAAQADRATAQANQAQAQAALAGQAATEAGAQAARAKSEADRAYRAVDGLETPGAEAQLLEAGMQPTAAWERDGDGLPVLKLGIPKGDRGAQGERGEPFRYDDFTAAQLEALRGSEGKQGPKGDKGDKGEPFVYADFTQDQLAALTGPAGQDGKDGQPGAPGSDASVTAENIASALGYTPADKQKVDRLSEEIDGLKNSAGSSSAVKSGEVLVIDDVSPEQHTVDVSLSSDSLSDFSGVTVIRSGKNLFGAVDFSTDKYNNVSPVFNADGSITLTNTSTINKGGVFDFAIPKQKQIAITVAEWPNVISVYKFVNDTATLIEQFYAGETRVFDNTAGEYSRLRITFFVDPGESVIRGIQAEIGTESTEYEIPNVQKYTANADGTVDDVQSISPTMVLFTDSNDVEIRAAYKAMGGNGGGGVSLDEIQPLIDEAKLEVIDSVMPISKVSGGKMVVIGDSISAGVSSHYYPDSGSVVTAGSAGSLLTKNGNAWWQLVRDRYGIADDVINNSVSGASFARDGSTGNPRFTTYLNDTAIPADTDIIMIFGGTNDWGVNVPLGALSDAADTSNAATFCAAVKAMLEYLTVHFADKQIVLITPMQRWFRAWRVVDGVREYTAADYDNDDASSIDNAFYNCRNGLGLYLREYVNALKQLCADYGVAVIDLYAESRMYVHDEAFKLIYAPDGLHPNELGTRRYVENGIFPRLDQMWRYRRVDDEV